MAVSDLANGDGCHLFLWSTSPHVPEALAVMSAWGFRYSGFAFTWIKTLRPVTWDSPLYVPSSFHIGLGHTTRKNVEIVLLGRRGNARRKARDVRELVIAEVREHSRKPDEVRERIEAYCDGPYLELFSRESRPGWTTWGNEAGKFDKRGQA